MKRALVVAFLLMAPGWATADVWDVTPHDNDSLSKNELVHGSEQVHDLAGTGDLDWYPIRQRPYASYEVVTDGTSGQIGDTLNLSLVDASGNSVTGLPPTGTGSAKSLRFMNTTSAAVTTRWVRASSPNCGTCTASAVYRVRAFDTTYAIPRFNNTSGQITAVIIQNPTVDPVNVLVYFWAATGGSTPLATQATTIQPKNSLVIQSQTLPGLSTASGAITVVSDAPYGRLAGKAVAMEASTGFSFDAFMTPIPH